MSWFRLLALGRSVVGLKSEPPRYKMAQENFLPKFDRQPGADSVAEVALAGSLARPTAAAAVALSDTNSVPLLSNSSPSRSFFGNRFKSRNAAKAARTWVQGELALGTVKVKRNDLSDTDVELKLIPGQPEKRRPNVTAPQADPAQAGRSRGWSELTARLFQAGGMRS